MGPEIIIPLIVLAIVVPVGFTWAKRTFKEGAGSRGAEVVAPGGRLTSSALRDLPSPPWRVVYEIADDKLGGVEHVAIGPPGAFAIETSMAPLPEPPKGAPDAHAVALAAITRGELDDVLNRCAMSSAGLVRVHWGADDTARVSVDVLPGATAVAGRSLADWAAGLPTELTPAQIDLAWQTVTTAIGRPDPLA